MKFYVIIPAYNEESYIAKTLESIASQSSAPEEVVVVNDNSTDRTAQEVEEFIFKHPFIKLLKTTSEAIHLPGSKVIRAFNKGLETLDADYDFIVKLDADLILPTNYFEKIIQTFKKDETIGMAGGFAYIEKDGNWILESLTDKDHIRGAFKAYRKKCFQDIGGLKPAMGWDTVDELLAKYYGWKVVTIPELKVKHLKPTGANYDRSARYRQGEAFYTLGYGFWITAIASAKLAMKKQKPMLFIDYLSGFFRAKHAKRELLVTPEQAQFIRKYRWKNMRQKLGI
jgi:glycosyltransferase involved in cell wall biosynthesis